MNMRREASERGLTRYNSGKPCRRGHVSDRYTCNGMCIECLNFHTVGQRTNYISAKAKKNLAMSDSFHEHAVVVKQGHRIVLEQLSDLLRYGDSVAIAEYINAAWLASPTPRSLTRADLLEFIQFDGMYITNRNDLELSHSERYDAPMFIIRNGLYYNGDDCMKVLREQQRNVKPTPRELT